MHWVNAILLMPQFPLKTLGKAFWKCFTQDRKGGENYDSHYYNSFRKYKDHLDH